MKPEELICKAQRKDNGEWIEGFYFCLHHNDGRTHLHHFIIPLEADLSKGTPLDKIQVEIEPESITLKAQEPIEARLHLCESCKKQFPECDTTKDGVMFGSGTGNDNIIGCTAYVNRWKAQEPRVMTLEEVRQMGQRNMHHGKAPRETCVYERRGCIGLATCSPLWDEPQFEGDQSHLDIQYLFLGTDEYDVVPVKKYGFEIRCWHGCPTDEQREATPWE